MIAQSGNHHYWPEPKSRDFAELGDPSIYWEILDIAYREDGVTMEKLISEEEGLSRSVRRLRLREFTRTSIKGVLSALSEFQWIVRIGNQKQYTLAPNGKDIYEKTKQNELLFRRTLALRMQERYVVPGWIIDRMYSLNPDGQGELILPSPLKKWEATPRNWEDSKWDDSLAEQALLAVNKNKGVLPNAFPVDLDEWLNEIRNSWIRQGNVIQKKVAKPIKGVNATEKSKIKTFSTRGRLTLSMRDASVKLLFANENPVTKLKDYRSDRPPILPRSFRAWCPVLDSLEMMFYTDSHPSISGRLIVPCSVFRQQTSLKEFELLNGVNDPEGKPFYFYQPKWENFHSTFLAALEKEYRTIAQKVGSIYISLLDVRDEICRQLRLSSSMFDTFLENAYKESVYESEISISLESDISSRQMGGAGLSRRPVFIEDVPHTLIAMARKN